LRVNALANAEVGRFLNEHFVSSFQKVATFKIVGGQKQGGNVASYFCAPDGRVLHAIAGPVDAATLPAATAIGTRSGDGRRVLQVYWLAARAAGIGFENPRQVSAWRYPRQYGIKAPTFARATRAPTQSAQVYISGTAAIVGHASHHHDDLAAQIDETLANIDSVLDAAQVAPAARLGAGAVLKVYVRRSEDAELARTLLHEKLPQRASTLLLQGDICRSELLVEIDGVQDA